MKPDFTELKKSFLKANGTLSQTSKSFTETPKPPSSAFKQAIDQTLSEFSSINEPLPVAKNLDKMNDNLVQINHTLEEQVRLAQAEAKSAKKTAVIARIISIIALIIAIADILVPYIF